MLYIWRAKFMRKHNTCFLSFFDFFCVLNTKLSLSLIKKIKRYKNPRLCVFLPFSQRKDTILCAKIKSLSVYNYTTPSKHPIIYSTHSIAKACINNMSNLSFNNCQMWSHMCLCRLWYLNFVLIILLLIFCPCYFCTDITC